MKRINLGELEELILLLVSKSYPDSYGVQIRHELKEHANRKVTLSTVHVALHRLESKGFVKSQMGDASPVRGGKGKRIFKITAYGTRALVQTREIRERLWEAMPEMAIQKT